MRVRRKSPILPVVVVLFGLLLIGMIPLRGMTHFTGVGISQPTEVGTATPALLVNNAGVSNIVEFRDGGTPAMFMTGGGALKIAPPTAVATATPGVVIDGSGVSALLEVRKAATKVFQVDGAGDVDISGLLLPSFTDLAISTAGQVLTPTYTVYALDSSAAISMTLAASAEEGQILVLIGDDANTITINDTNIRTSDGNAATIGQYDVIVWVYQDSEWLQVVKTADS